MRNNEIEGRLKRGVSQAPIDLLEIIQNTPVEKMKEHDAITAQYETTAGPRMWKPLLAAAVFLLMIGFSWMYTQTEIAKLYLDINPSLSLSVNRMDRVKDVTAYNEEAILLLDGLNLKGLKKDEAIALLYEKMPTVRNTALVSVSSKDEQLSRKELDDSVKALRGAGAKKNQDLLVLGQQVQPSAVIIDGSTVYHVSPGKLEFIKKLIVAGSTKPMDELVNLSIEEIVRSAYDDDIEVEKVVEVTGPAETLKPAPKPVPPPTPFTLPKTEPPATEPPRTEAPRTEAPVVNTWSDDDDDDDWDDDNWDDDYDDDWDDDSDDDYDDDDWDDDSDDDDWDDDDGDDD